ncbi:cobalamin biosynthesis protein [Conexibacter sp. SYSU D00693]|uniref:cobalamin biosynthesis protein n=1 Tax=Conexibacter sp. SYSU D00693 TaxID=2812560 RepID=UPI00196BA5DD|nr:cobalamin biosynthesis protein [Conexibacter sp. SYSU D00693]
MIAVGVGCSRGCAADELLELVDGALAAARVETVDVLASIDVKADEPGLLEAAARRGWPLAFHAAETLRTVPVPTPSAVVAGHVGTPSVAEAAALLSAAPAELLVPKRRSANATCAVAVRRRGLSPSSQRPANGVVG